MDTPAAAPAPAETATEAPVEAPATTETKAAPEAAASTPTPTHRVKIAGEERDLSTEDLVKLAQKAGGVEKRFEQLSAREKRLAAVEERLVADPILRAYLERGEDGLYAAIEERLEYEGLAPDERKKRDTERERDAKAARADEYEKREQEREQAALAAQYEAQLAPAISKALEAHGVGGDPVAFRRVAATLEAALDAGKPLTAELLAKAAAKVAGAFARDKAATLAELRKLDPAALVELLGPEAAKKLRAHEAAAHKARQPQVERTPAKPNGRAKAAPSVRSTEAFMKSIRGGG